MNAQLIIDINTKKEKSRFMKIAPNTFGFSPNYNELKKQRGIDKGERKYTISPDIFSKQKGDITEAPAAESVTLYGDTSLSCYKPTSDDEGIGLIVKKKEI